MSTLFTHESDQSTDRIGIVVSLVWGPNEVASHSYEQYVCPMHVSGITASDRFLQRTCRVPRDSANRASCHCSDKKVTSRCRSILRQFRLHLLVCSQSNQRIRHLSHDSSTQARVEASKAGFCHCHPYYRERGRMRDARSWVDSLKPTASSVRTLSGHTKVIRGLTLS